MERESMEEELEGSQDAVKMNRSVELSATLSAHLASRMAAQSAGESALQGLQDVAPYAKNQEKVAEHGLRSNHLAHLVPLLVQQLGTPLL